MMPRKGREEAEGWVALLKYFCVSQMPNLKIPRKKAVSGFGFMATNRIAMKTYLLKNGKQVFHLNEYETDFLYKELFVDRVYLKNGIQLTGASVVVDIGANIGLFAVFLQEQFPGCKIVLVEPSPVLCEIIRANTNAFADQVQVVQKGISNARKEADFTFYAGYSILSGFKADAAKDAQFLRGGIKSQLSRLRLSPEREEEFIASLMEGKLSDPQCFKAELISLDDLITAQDLQRIDLLKIDAEGCEMEILMGVGASNWPKIKQLVMEVHDAEGCMLGKIVELIEAHGFKTLVEQEANFKETGICNLYASRR